MLTLQAYAKINLGLRILRRRADGFHDLETVFHRVNICDQITLSDASTISLNSASRDLPANEENLCIRAATMMQQRFSIDSGAHIDLQKNIPIGAGLGGGSSDAATVLLGVNQMWNVHASIDELRPLALELGSDVPYFLREGSAYATGRGDILEYFHLDVPYWIVVVYPNIHISTKWAYEKTHLEFRTPRVSSDRSHVPLKSVVLEHLGNARILAGLLPNDFEPLVMKTHEAIALVKQSLMTYGAAFAQLSGSGSSVYGLFPEESHARVAFRALGPVNRVFLTPPGFQP